MEKQIYITPDSSHKVYNIREVPERVKLYPNIPADKIYCVYGMIEWFDTELVDMTDTYMLLKSIINSGDSVVYYIVSRETSMTCNDIRISRHYPVKLDGDRVVIDITDLKEIKNELFDDIRYNFSSEASKDCIGKIVSNIESDYPIRISYNIIKSGFYFMYISDRRNSFLEIYDPETKLLICEIK